MLSIIPLPYRLLAYALIAAALLAFGFFKGYAKGSQRLFDYQAAVAKEAVRIVTKRGEVTTQVVTKYVKVQQETENVENAVKLGVLEYAKKNAGFTLDPAWRRLHDAAALNRLPDPAPGVDAAPTAAQSLATVTGNYASCNADQDRLAGLQEWVRTQAAVK